MHMLPSHKGGKLTEIAEYAYREVGSARRTSADLAPLEPTTLLALRVRGLRNPCCGYIEPKK